MFGWPVGLVGAAQVLCCCDSRQLLLISINMCGMAWYAMPYKATVDDITAISPLVLQVVGK